MKKLLVLSGIVWVLAACTSASLSSDEAAVLTPGAYAQPVRVQGTQTPPMSSVGLTSTPWVQEPLVTNTPWVEMTRPTATAYSPQPDAPTATPRSDAPSPTPTLRGVMLTETPPPSEPWQESERVIALQAKVAENYGLSVKSLAPVLFESATWRDSSLGCPQPGMEYLQVLNEGWRAVFNDEAGTMYEIHATENLGQVVFCPDSQIGRLDDASTEKLNDATKAAISLLVDHLKVITPEQVAVVSVEAVQWPNS